MAIGTVPQKGAEKAWTAGHAGHRLGFPPMPPSRSLALAGAAAIAYFGLGLGFYDPLAWDERNFDATAVTVTTLAWLSVVVLGAGLLGRDWGAGYALGVTFMQIPMSLIAGGGLMEADFGVWWFIMALFSIVVGGITGSLADHYREARIRNAELARKNVELERSTHALAQSERMFREFAEHVEVGVWIVPHVDGKGDHSQLYLNPAGRRMYGGGAGTPSWADSVHADDLPGLLAAEASLGDSSAMDLEFRTLDEHGSTRWLRTQGFPIRDPEGRLVRVVGLLDDITERKEREARRELLERRERLSALGTLVAGVAHEINNPLTYLMGNMQLAEDELRKATGSRDPSAHTAKAVRLLRTSVEGGERIAKIVRALRAVTRSGGESEREPVRLNSVAMNVHELMRTGVPRTIELELALSHDDPAVNANAAELHQVLLNLATNAVQALGTRPGRVVIETRADGDDSILSVRDDGPGIPPDVRARLFTPFYTTKAEGTGLGLSLAHAIVRAHGGEIEIESAPDHGALFRVRLPRALVAQAHPTNSTHSPEART